MKNGCKKESQRLKGGNMKKEPRGCVSHTHTHTHTKLSSMYGRRMLSEVSILNAKTGRGECLLAFTQDRL